MRVIPIGTGTLVFGVRIVRTDGEVLAWTQHNKDQTVNIDTSPGDLLLANPGFSIQQIVKTAGLGVDNTTINVLAGEDMTRADILARKWDGAEVYFFQYDWKNPLDGIIPFITGSFGNFKPKLGEFEVEFRDIRQALQPNSTWVFQEACRWRLGDARCGKDLTAFTHSCEVLSVASAYVFTIDEVQANDYFGEGEILWLTGDNAGLRHKIKTNTAGAITLMEAVVYAVQEGDTGTIIAGCRKRWEEDCKTKFDNLRRFGGEKDKPTRDQIIRPADPS